MVEIRKLAIGRGQTINELDPRIIQVMPGLNARDMDSAETREHVAELAAKMRAQGFLGSHPIEVFQEKDVVYVSAGHCRLAAVMSLIDEGHDFKSIPTINEDKHTSQAQRLLNQITSNSGQKLNLAEEGKVFKRLMAMGYTYATVAKEAGCSESHVRQALGFQAAPQEAHELVKEGKVSATLAAKTVREEGGAKGVEKLKAAVKTAEAAGKKKATAKHIEPREPKAPKATPQPARDNTMSAVSLARRLAKCGDPLDMDAGECLRTLQRFRDDARRIVYDPDAPEAQQAQAAE